MNANAPAATTETAKPKTPKTTAITLTANGTTMRGVDCRQRCESREAWLDAQGGGSWLHREAGCLLDVACTAEEDEGGIVVTA